MFTRLRQVHYCEWCGRHWLSARSALVHEGGCTLNPARVCVCGAAGVDSSGPLVGFVAGFAPLDRERLALLRERAGGCPWCVVAALRLSGLRTGELFVDGVGWRDVEMPGGYRRLGERAVPSAG